MPSTTAPTQHTGNGAAARSRPHAQTGTTTTARAAARNRTRVIAGALIMLASALIAGLLYANLGDRHPVIAIARPVSAGQIIQQADLAETLAPSIDGVRTTPWSQRASVVGRTAAVALVPGSLLNSSQLASGPTIDPTDTVVGAVLKPGFFPAGLRPGDKVLAIVLPPDSATSGQDHIDPPINATITTISPLTDSGGSVSVALAVAPGDATTLAVAGARGRLTLALAPR